MTDDTDKLAAEMQGLKPSKAARTRGMAAAMAAFDSEFIAETAASSESASQAATQKKSDTSQGLAGAPRPTGHTTHAARVQTFGSLMMSKLNNFFNLSPRAAMMGGSCMAALIAAVIILPNHDYSVDPLEPIAPVNVPITEPKTSEPVISNPAISDPVTIEPVITPEPKTDIVVPKVDATPKEPVISDPEISAPVLETPSVKTADGEGKTDASVTEPPTADIAVVTPETATPSNVVTIERRIIKTPGQTVERVVPAIPRVETRRRIKTPARTVERRIPPVTKTETRRVEKADGTFETISELVVVQPESVEYVTTPAEYETYQETVIVQEASTELVTVPPVFETVRETIELQPDGSTKVIASEIVASPKPSEGASSGITSVGELRNKLGVVDSGAAYFSEEIASHSDVIAPSPVMADEIVVTASKRKGSARKIASAPIAPPPPSPAFERSRDASVTSDGKRSFTLPEGARLVERAVPAVTKQVPRRVVKTPASTTERVIPAITKDVTFRIQKADGTYEDVVETIVIQEAYTEIVTPPPVYETVMETIVVQPKSVEMVIVMPDGSIERIESPVVPPEPKPKPQPQAGQLTAGDYDDVLNPDLYKVYLDKVLQGPLGQRGLPYVDADRRIDIRILDRAGKAVPMADITLETPGGKRMFPLRTGADGMAYLYPYFDGLKAGVSVKVSVDGANSVTKTLTQSQISNGGDLVVNLQTDSQAFEKMDLLLTIDATGSMADEMRYLQSELKAILRRVEDANPGIDIRTGLIVYRDEGDAYVVREVPFTGDIDAFKSSLDKQNAHGGGDMPEAMHKAMNAGLKMAWRDDALKVNLLVADAPPHNRYISDTWEAGLLSRTRGVHIVPVAASGVDKTAEFLMRSMAQITGGRYLFLTDDSGIGNPHAEPTVDCYIVTRLDGLVTRVLNSLVKGVRVEPEAGEVIRSVGNYRSGKCILDQNEQAVSPVNVNYKKR